MQLEILAGSGGAEPEYFAGRALKMYVGWLARHDFGIRPGRIIERTDAGIKRAVLEIEGDADLLRSETGVHRYVRKSPFDNEARRHTSFVSVRVGDMPIEYGSFGAHQIRSYIFDPYKMVKDLRTAHSTENVDAVLDGEMLDEFLAVAKSQGWPRHRDDDSSAAVMD